MFDGALMIEMTKTAVVLEKAGKFLVVRWREKRWIWKNAEDGEKVYFSRFQSRLKSKLIRRVREQQNCYGGPSTKWTSWKGNDMLEKVD